MEAFVCLAVARDGVEEGGLAGRVAVAVRDAFVVCLETGVCCCCAREGEGDNEDGLHCWGFWWANLHKHEGNESAAHSDIYFPRVDSFNQAFCLVGLDLAISRRIQPLNSRLRKAEAR